MKRSSNCVATPNHSTVLLNINQQNFKRFVHAAKPSQHKIVAHYKRFEIRRVFSSGVASSISEGDIFIYLCSAQLTSLKIDLISKEIDGAEHEYMNMSPSLIELATPLVFRPCLDLL